MMKVFEVRLQAVIGGNLKDDFVGHLCLNEDNHEVRGVGSNGSVFGYYNQKTNELNLIRLKDRLLPLLYTFKEAAGNGEMAVYSDTVRDFLSFSHLSQDVSIKITPTVDVAPENVLDEFISRMNRAPLVDLMVLRKTMLESRLYEV